MKKALVLTLSMITVLLLISSIPCALAEDHNPIVRIYDSTWTETDYFPTCPVTVGIKTKSAYGPYDVLVVEPDGVTTHTIQTGVPGDNQWYTFAYTCTKTGWWTAKAGSTTIPFGCGTFHVIPELGTLMAMVASFVALGGLGTSRRLRLKR